MRIGAVLARKGDYVGGSLSPTLSPSPYRTSRDEVCVQISFTDLGRDSIAGSLAEFITEQQRKELENAVRDLAARTEEARAGVGTDQER